MRMLTEFYAVIFGHQFDRHVTSPPPHHVILRLMTTNRSFATQEQAGPQLRKRLSVETIRDRNTENITTHKRHDYESRITAWMARNGVVVTRTALGLIFVWFGALKFLPGMSDAEDVARKTLMKLTFGEVPPQIGLYILAAWESAIGIGLLWGRFLKATLVLLFLQQLGTFLPLLFFPSETWKHAPFVPTLEGQYIIKNLVLVSAGIIVGSTVQGGKIISDPYAARIGARAEKLYSRFRKRFRQEPKVENARRISNSDKAARSRQSSQL